MENKTLYKFLREGLKSDSGHHEWKLNTWYKIDGKISICNKGFHASKTPLQALGYVGGEILAKVEVKGKSEIQDDKECWSDMRIVTAYHWKKEDSIELAIFSAELVIDIYEKKYPGDDRPRKAIEAAKAYLKDPTKDADAAAYAAADAAARAAYEAADAAYAAADAAYAAAAADAAAYAAAYAADAAAAAAAYAAAAADAAYAAAARAAAYAAARAADAIRPKIDAWFTKKIKTLTKI